MNSSSESADQAANYVLATKWVIEGLLLPIIGSVGIVGKNFQILMGRQKSRGEKHSDMLYLTWKSSALVVWDLRSHPSNSIRPKDRFAESKSDINLLLKPWGLKSMRPAMC